jgi:hypothetical protein
VPDLRLAGQGTLKARPRPRCLTYISPDATQASLHKKSKSCIAPPRSARTAEEGCSYRRELCARAGGPGREGLRASERGKAKGRRLGFRPYERSRCAEHGGSCRLSCSSCARRAEEVMVAPLEVPRNAEGAQSEGRVVEDG